MFALDYLLVQQLYPDTELGFRYWVYWSCWSFFELLTSFMSLCSPAFLHILLMCPVIHQIQKKTKPPPPTKPFQMVESRVSCGLFRDYTSGVFKVRQLHHSLLTSTMKKSGSLKKEVCTSFLARNISLIRHLYIIIMDYFFCYSKVQWKQIQDPVKPQLQKTYPFALKNRQNEQNQERTEERNWT